MSKSRYEEYGKDYYKKNKKEILSTIQKYRKNNKEKLYNKMLLYNYGITREDYNNIFDKQKGCCAICGVHQSELNRPLCVDHNHETNIVRGLLCKKCNLVLGFAYDNISILEKSITYLSK